MGVCIQPANLTVQVASTDCANLQENICKIAERIWGVVQDVFLYAFIAISIPVAIVGSVVLITFGALISLPYFALLVILRIGESCCSRPIVVVRPSDGAQVLDVS